MRFPNICVTVLFILFAASFNLNGQSLESQLKNVFKDVLELDLAGSPGAHGTHFRTDNVEASDKVINTLSNFIGSSISSFPLSSTAAGLTFDFSSGRPVATSTSLGPIFSERAQTMGSGFFNMGFNFTHLSFTKIRGINTEDLKLSFTHQNVGGPDYGDSANEFDTIDFFMNLDVSSTIFALYFTFGVTDRLDIGLAIPFINVKLKASPLARVNSYTYLTGDSANHHFGDNAGEPVLSKNTVGIKDDATGMGDIAIRAKYNIMNKNVIDLATVVEYRHSTGTKSDFLGSGNNRVRTAFIASKIIGDFAPHLNVSYELNNSDTQRDRVGLFIGYDQKLTEKLTLAVDFLGEYELGDQIEELTFPDPVTATRPDGSYTQTTNPTNLPDIANDHLLNGAVGLKFNPKKNLLFIGNVFFPLNDGGLRADFIPTFGVEFSF